jgi:hypothetical protein
MESQLRLQDLVRQLQNCKGQIFQRDRNSRMVDATLAQLALEEQEVTTQAKYDFVTYKSVGKLYVCIYLPQLTLIMY